MADKRRRMKKTAKPSKSSKYKKSMKVISILFLCTSMTVGVNIWKIRGEMNDYRIYQQELNMKMEEAEKQSQIIEAKKKYYESDAYIEDLAREKIGLVFKNEIVFKKQGR